MPDHPVLAESLWANAAEGVVKVCICIKTESGLRNIIEKLNNTRTDYWVVSLHGLATVAPFRAILSTHEAFDPFRYRAAGSLLLSHSCG